MPLLSTLGAASSLGFGRLGQQEQKLYVEDVFSTWLYTGNGSRQVVNNGIAFVDTAEWSTYKLRQSTSEGRHVTTDSSGNFYVTGFARDGSNYFIVAKYNSSGSLSWARKLQQSNSQGQGVEVDSTGNVYATGYVSDGTNIYFKIVKYNSSGSIQWQRRLLENYSYGRSVAVDSADNVYVTGQARDGSDYILTAKYNSSGTIQWQRKLRQNNSVGYGIAVDGNDDVYVVGQANDGSNYILVAKYNSSGTIQWQRKLREGGSSGFGIAVDSTDNIYVTGQASDGSGYIIIAKYNSSGSLQWQRKLRQNHSGGYGISVDSGDNIYVTGYLDGGSSGSIVAKYNSSGAIQWQRRFLQVGIGGSEGDGIKVDSTGNVYVTGYATDDVSSYIATVKLKADGTTASGTAFVTLFEGGATDSSGTATDSAGTATDSAGTATDSAGGATDSASGATASTATQGPVSGSAGGLVWIKDRSTTDHALFDTERGAGKLLTTNNTNAQGIGYAQSFTSSGFSLTNGGTFYNGNGLNYASWTFRKAPKFFDVVTYTGNNTAGRTISHSLGVVPGMIIVKRTDSAGGWWVYHRSTGNTQYGALNATDAFSTFNMWNNTSPTDTVFSLSGSANVNSIGATYVAYLFAHDTTADGIVQCGSFTTDVSGNADVSLGWEPQLILWKSSSNAQNWYMHDNMRGMGTFSPQTLYPNLTNAEAAYNAIRVNSTGFSCSDNASRTYIYLAIRRGPMRTPTDATKVFMPEINTSAVGTVKNTGFRIDSQIINFRDSTQPRFWVDRLRGVNTKVDTSTVSPYLITTTTLAEQTTGNILTNNWNNTSFSIPQTMGANSSVYYSFSRAPGFFDVVCYTGTGSASIKHNLGAVPELIIIKRRSNASRWPVWRTSVGTNTSFAELQDSRGEDNQGVSIMAAAPTATDFTLSSWGTVSGTGETYVAYLFASCPGVSKVGSYTGTGTTQQIDCGFTAGARFVLIKRTDSTGGWYVYDSARGIVAGNDPYLLLNSTAAEVTSTDYVDAYAAGFELSSTAPAGLNANGGTFIFLAIS